MPLASPPKRTTPEIWRPAPYRVDESKDLPHRRDCPPRQYGRGRQNRPPRPRGAHSGLVRDFDHGPISLPRSLPEKGMPMVFLAVALLAVPATHAVGVVLPLTGPRQQRGEMLLDSIQMKADEINRAGGIDGRRIELVVRDTRNLAELSR